MKSLNQADIAYYLQKTELIAFDRAHCHSIDKRLLKKRKLIIEGLPSTKLINPLTTPAPVYCLRKLTIPIMILLFLSNFWTKKLHFILILQFIYKISLFRFGYESKRNMTKAVAYYRTSSMANFGDDKNSLKRQQRVVEKFAKSHTIEIFLNKYDVRHKKHQASWLFTKASETL